MSKKELAQVKRYMLYPDQINKVNALAKKHKNTPSAVVRIAINEL